MYCSVIAIYDDGYVHSRNQNIKIEIVEKAALPSKDWRYGYLTSIQKLLNLVRLAFRVLVSCVYFKVGQKSTTFLQNEGDLFF